MGNKYLGNISQRLSLFKIDSLVYKNSLKLTYWKYFENIIDVNLEMTFEKMTFTKFQIKFSKTIHIQSLKTVCKQDVTYIWVRLDWIEAVQPGSRKKSAFFDVWSSKLSYINVNGELSYLHIPRFYECLRRQRDRHTFDHSPSLILNGVLLLLFKI